MTSRNRLLAAIVVFTLGLSSGGCAWFAHPDFHMPRWRSPGPAFYQQHQALQHDPYPSDDLGPEIVGGRPRAYEQPPPDVIQARQSRPWANWRGY